MFSHVDSCDGERKTSEDLCHETWSLAKVADALCVVISPLNKKDKMY